MTQLSDEILIAYADGELGPSQIRVVDGVLAVDELTHERFRLLKETNTRLSNAFASMLQAEAKQMAVERASSQPLPPPQQQAPISQANGSRGLMVPAIAAGVLLVVVGAVGGYLAGNAPEAGGQGTDPFRTANFWNTDQMKAEEARSRGLYKEVKAPRTTASTGRKDKAGARWFELVAARHKKDGAHLLDQYNGKSRNRDLALFQFSKSDVAPSMIPQLKDEALTFVGASPLQIKGKNYARLAYRDLSNGAVPVGLYVGNKKGGSLTLERGYRGEDNYVRWTQGPRSYMLIGAVPHWRLIVLSVAVQRQLVQ